MAATDSGSLFTCIRPRRLYWFAFRVRWRARRAWLNLTAPYKLHPETLYGMDGEPPVFVRADLAATREDAAHYYANDCGISFEDACVGMDPIEDIALIWMVPRYDHTVPEDDDRHCWYDTVEKDTLGAVAYWRWNW